MSFEHKDHTLLKDDIKTLIKNYKGHPKDIIKVLGLKIDESLTFMWEDKYFPFLKELISFIKDIYPIISKDDIISGFELTKHVLTKRAKKNLRRCDVNRYEYNMIRIKRLEELLSSLSSLSSSLVNKDI